MWITYIIGILLNVFLALILRKTKHYDSGIQPFKLLGIVWIVWGLLTLIPILNFILGIICTVEAIIAFCNDNIWFDESEEKHWLFRKH